MRKGVLAVVLLSAVAACASPGAEQGVATTPPAPSTTPSVAPTSTGPSDPVTTSPPTPTTPSPTSSARPAPRPTQRHTSSVVVPTTSARPTTTDAFRPVVTRVTAEDVRWTWHEGCPVGASQLRKVTMGFRGYDGAVRRGVLIVRADKVPAVIAVFRAAFDAGFRIHRMDNPNLWHGDDEAMMAADNTSAFNCRQVVGDTGRVSPHSYGYAFDVNPRRNPYLAADGVWYPPNGLRWVDRSLRDAGMVRSSSAITRAVLARGGIWGGAWGNPDYQHYELR